MLLTLPRFQGQIAEGMAVTVATATLAPSHAQRGRKAAELLKALSSGRITPNKVLEALSAGDCGIAQLAADRLPRVPRLTSSLLPSHVSSILVSNEARDSLVELVESLGESGDLTQSACRALSRAPAPSRHAIGILCRAWVSRTRRVTAPILESLAPDLKLEQTHYVLPGALWATLFPSDKVTYHGDTPVDGLPQVRVQACGTLVVPCPTNLNDGAEHDAVCAAWDRVVAKLQWPMLENSQHALQTLCGYSAESLIDASLQCPWKDGVPQVSFEDAQDIGSDAGFEVEDQVDYENVLKCLKYFRAVGAGSRAARAKRLKPMAALVQPSRFSGLVKSLNELATVAEQMRKVPSKRLAEQFGDDGGLFPACMQPNGTGMDQFFDYVCEQSYQSCGPDELTIWRAKESNLRLGTVLDRVVWDAAIAAAAVSLVAKACRDRVEPQSAG